MIVHYDDDNGSASGSAYLYTFPMIDNDGDGITDYVDNCLGLIKTDQLDFDSDEIGDACDPCDNLVYISGNLNGDLSLFEEPIINIMDVLTLVDFLISGESYECQDIILNINGDEHINIVDVISLVQLILN